MIKLLVSFIFFFNQAAMAGLPPTSAKGQAEANPTTTFFFQAPNSQFTTTASATRLIETGNENLLVNPSFETGDLTGWTSGGFTFTKVTSIVASGLVAAGFSVTSIGNIVTQTVTPTIKIAGRNLVASAWVYSSIGGGVSVCFLEAGVEKNCIAAPGGAGTWYPVSATFTGITDGDSIAIRVKSTSGTAANVYVDDAYLGIFNMNQYSIDTGWSNGGAVPMSTTGSAVVKPTMSIDQELWKRVGDSIQVQIAMISSGTSATPGTGDYLFGMPAAANCIIDTTKVYANTTTGGGSVDWPATAGTGTSALQGTQNSNGRVTVYNSQYVRIFSGPATGSYLPVGPANNNNYFNVSPVAYSASFTVPCVGWTTLNAISPQQSSSLWSGYHDNTCSWARTSTSYGDPTADATCNLVQRQTANFGTVTTYGGASTLPGVIFTPAASGQYFVCATPKIAGATLAATLDVRLWDGTTTIAEAESQQQVATDIEQLTICGIDNLTSGVSTTFSLQTKATSGAVTIAANSTNASAVEWSIVNLTYATPSPLLVNSVVSSRQGVTLRDAARVTCGNSGSTIPSQSASWTVANGASAGLCTVTLSPTFSLEPVCECTVIGTSSASGASCLLTAAPSGGSVSLSRVQSGALTNGDVELTCSGAK